MYKSSRKKGLREHCGYTVMGTLVSVSIVILLLAIAIPNVDQLMSSYYRGKNSQQLILDIRRARSEALTNGVRGIVSINSSGDSYSFGIDRPPYSSSAQADQIIFVRNLDTGISASLSQNVIFDSRGVLIDTTGAITTLNLALQHAGDDYFSGTLYSTGYLELS